ncbi:peptide-N(4)-(N-acetyl-beta-glucosaminyl)asparagine amidase isoform X3 [Ostrinia furnacalis]|uniref:peptide-N(4)-(N-acetyl-beta- glucosaminyl)asparagine amidase isoform X3 n=1 Tax=Ostrinia furnacalis TaxID=93504 RepID=UPI00103FB531|nr:peptide-N(4)-(N-acetyl-beta-glucosaminyl)asparagine amidase isoform X3 [Ostrinia furnacalis]
MEDIPRLAVVEQHTGDSEKFTKLLIELLRVITNILESPHDYDLRTIQSDLLKKHLGTEPFSEYLKYVGFQLTKGEIIYPKEQTLNKLRIAQAAIERKISICCGPVKPSRRNVTYAQCMVQAKKPKLVPLNVLNTKNALLLKIQSLFNNMIKYEDEELQQLAREEIPLVTLQLMALDRIREHQRKIKTGEINTHDLPFDIALLMELLGWFKHKYFKWVDKPECNKCGGATKYSGSSSMNTPTETCTVELYTCIQCGRSSEFPRFNDPKMLLRTRRGRCGEWANCFTLLCRALGYDTRFVYDTTDHVWCEVFDYDSRTWLHVDPCEAKLNAPLIYSHGWGKKLSYVIAVSRDDVQDVTWRYTTNFKEVLTRRTLVLEHELLAAIMILRERRQRQVSAPRRAHLTRRTLGELAQLMCERKPSDYECHGRISGSKEWRTDRGELGCAAGKEFIFRDPGSVAVRYYPAADEYRVTGQATVSPWSAGAFAARNVFRKVEYDWQQVYIAREEGTEKGFMSWKLRAIDGACFDSLCARASYATFHSGQVEWRVRFDDEAPMPAEFGESPMRFERRFYTCEIMVELSGGSGAEGWQHAQLFRRPASATAPALELLGTVVLEKAPVLEVL